MSMKKLFPRPRRGTSHKRLVDCDADIKFTGVGAVNTRRNRFSMYVSNAVRKKTGWEGNENFDVYVDSDDHEILGLARVEQGGIKGARYGDEGSFNLIVAGKTVAELDTSLKGRYVIEEFIAAEDTLYLVKIPEPIIEKTKRKRIRTFSKD